MEKTIKVKMTLEQANMILSSVYQYMHDCNYENDERFNQIANGINMACDCETDVDLSTVGK